MSCKCPICGKEYAANNGVLQHRRREHPNSFDQYCSDCGKGVRRLGGHIAHSGCDYPDITDEVREILKGLVMGDGWVMNRDMKSPIVSVEMINERFLEWLDAKLGVLSMGCEKRDETKFALRTMGHPEFHKFAEWYDGGKKRFPESLTLTPLSAKVWYACDGGIQPTKNRGRAKFYSVNESDRPSYLESLFSHIEGKVEYQDSQHAVVFQKEATESLLEWMGEPLPGFNYKWCITGRQDYKQMKGEL